MLHPDRDHISRRPQLSGGPAKLFIARRFVVAFVCAISAPLLVGCPSIPSRVPVATPVTDRVPKGSPRHVKGPVVNDFLKGDDSPNTTKTVTVFTPVDKSQPLK